MIIEEMYGAGVGQKVWAAFTKCLQELFEEYRNNSSPSDVQPQPSESPNSKEGGEDCGKLKAKLTKKMRFDNATSSYSRGSRTELDRYLAEECEEDSKKFDVLAWWKGQSSTFPILSTLARDVLAIPISTVASESAFSTGGRILDDFRSSLTPFMIEALVCTQDWLRRETPINLTENTEELAQLQEELIQEFRDKAIVDDHAAKSQIQGSKRKMVTSTSISQPSKSTNPSQSSKESKNKKV